MVGGTAFVDDWCHCDKVIIGHRNPSSGKCLMFWWSWIYICTSWVSYIPANVFPPFFLYIIYVVVIPFIYIEPHVMSAAFSPPLFFFFNRIFCCWLYSWMAGWLILYSTINFEEISGADPRLVSHRSAVVPCHGFFSPPLHIYIDCRTTNPIPVASKYKKRLEMIAVIIIDTNINDE